MSKDTFSGRRLSVFQILVLCGNREQKHGKVICDWLGVAPNTVAVWASRGVPIAYWRDIAKLADVHIAEVINAHAHMQGVPHVDMEAKHMAAQEEGARQQVDSTGG